MKIAPVVIGAVFAQSSGDSEEVYAESADRWDSWGSDNTFNVDTGKTYTGSWNTASRKTVQAVTCWESNNMGDLAHFTSQNDDGFGWANVHHGHDQAANAAHITTDDNDYQIGTFVDGQTSTSANQLDLHSLLAYDNRYSGCIYEVADWVYNSDNYNRMWQVQYGYDGVGATLDPTGIDTSVTATPLRTNWWHYFNAHVVISDDTNDTNDARTHYITMANPSYEGLGYLNFIATYAKASSATFTSANWATRNGQNFNTNDSVTDLYSGGYAYSIIPGDNTSTWYSVYTATDADNGTWASFAAVSSFPHNDLGKDFRFNVRVLHHGGNGDPSDTATGKDSYYFYRINEIDIVFPYTVRCPREANNVAADGAGNTFRCMDGAGNNGHRAWDKATPNPQSSALDQANKPIYIETLSGGLPSAATASMCTATSAPTGQDKRWYKCGNVYKVTGLLNSYDEHSQAEFGNHQEFWFQFEYHFEFAGIQAPAGNPQISGTTNADYNINNLPNILFNAFELKTVDFVCSTASESRNRCQ